MSRLIYRLLTRRTNRARLAVGFLMPALWMSLWAQIYIPFHLMTEEHEGAPLALALASQRGADQTESPGTWCELHGHYHPVDDEGAAQEPADHDHDHEHDDPNHHHPHSAGDHLADWHVPDVPHLPLFVCTAPAPLLETPAVVARTPFSIKPTPRTRGPPCPVAPVIV